MVTETLGKLATDRKGVLFTGDYGCCGVGQTYFLADSRWAGVAHDHSVTCKRKCSRNYLTPKRHGLIILEIGSPHGLTRYGDLPALFNIVCIGTDAEVAMLRAWVE